MKFFSAHGSRDGRNGRETAAGTLRKTALLLAFLGVVAPVALAVSTAFWVVSTQEEFLKGTCKGVAVSSEGELVPGLSFDKTALPADAVWCILPRGGGLFLLGTGNKGKVFAFDGKDVKEVADTGSLAVTALADDGNGLILAAAMPDGNVYRLIPGEGIVYKKELFAKLPASYVWSIVFNRKDGAFYAATGPEGQIYRLSTDGAVTLWLDTKETHVLSLACAPDGTLFAGTSPRGLVMRVEGKGRFSVLYDCAEEEVWRMTLSADGVIACANKAGAGGGPGNAPRQGKNAPSPSSGSLPTHAPTAFSVYRVREDGGAVRLFGRDKAFAWSVGVDGTGRVLVSTGNDGRIFRVAPDGSSYETLAQLESKAAALMAFSAGEPVLFAGNNPAALYAVDGDGTGGEYVSSVFDAGFTAAWGKVSLVGRGKVSLRVRSGFTAEVDDTWSDWSAPVGLKGGLLSCPRGRFIQFKAVLEEPGSALKEVRIPFLVDNQRPEIAAFSVKRQLPRGTARPRGKPSPGGNGQRVERSAPPPHSPKLALEWKAKDPDGDPLLFRLYFRYPKAPSWMPLTREDDPLKEPKYVWDTTGLPEGRYAVKLVVSDEANNPPGKALSAVRVKEPVVVDNTPPSVPDLRLEGNLLRASASDSTSRIVRMELQVDGERPRLLFPADGIYDDRTEKVEADISRFASPGEHIITLYAVDAEGNRGSASIVAVVVP